MNSTLSVETVRAEVTALMGDAFLQLGHYAYAFRHYRQAVTTERERRITECGNLCLDHGVLETGIACFEALGLSPPSDKLIACGDFSLRQGDYGSGEKAYRIAGVPIPLERLIECGTVAANKQWTQTAILAFRKAGSVEPAQRAR